MRLGARGGAGALSTGGRSAITRLRGGGVGAAGTHAAAGGGSVGLTLLVVFQTRELSGLCAAEEYILPGLFLFLPPQALTWWTSRTVAR